MGIRYMATARKSAIALMFAGMAVAGSVSATLMDRGGGLIYDTDLNITWLADANYAATQYTATGGTQGDADGRMTWSAANAWAATLVYHDSVRNIDYSDWRLPTTLQPDATCGITDSLLFSLGYGCNGSEMGHLFYTGLSGVAGTSILTSSDPDLALFSDVVPSHYWSGTQYPGYANPSYAWRFDFGNGYQSAVTDFQLFWAWAVRDGDVAAVPEPASVALIGLGLFGLGFARRKKA